MTKLQKHTEASLLFGANCNPLRFVDVVALRAMIENIGATVESVRRKSGEYILLNCDRVQILVAFCPVPFPMDHFQGVCRPPEDEENRTRIFEKLETHAESLTVLVTSRDGAAVDPGMDHQILKRRLCLEVVDSLLAMMKPSLVFWMDEDQLLTPEEAETTIARHSDGHGQQDGQIQHDGQIPGPDFPEDIIVVQSGPRNRRQLGALTSRTRRPDEIRIAAPAGRAGLTMPAVGSLPCKVTPRRPDRAPASTRRPQIFKSDPYLSPQIDAWFNPQPDLVIEAAADPHEVSLLRAFLAHEEGDHIRSLSDTSAGRASLYAMSATIMVFALPVGAGVLTYNALSGGSMRATAHMMALTGIGTALTALGLPNPAMALAGIL